MTRSPALYQRILYDVELETRAFGHLADLDIGGCRACLGALVDGLDLSGIDGDGKQVVQLLVDILHKVNQRLHQLPGADGSYQVNRVELIERFLQCDRAEDARGQFFPAMKRILSALESRHRALHPLVERAKSVIDANYHRRISLSLIADRLHVSSNYLSRMFRRETGITLTAYVHRVRLEHAMLLLAEGGRSISEIAYRVGYQNYRDFYRNFVKYEKRSPRQMRRRLLEKSADSAQRPHRERGASGSGEALQP
jgi:AraC-like DNA-binding protein